MPVPWFVFLVPGLAVALGLAFAVEAVRVFRTARACAGWPTVMGRILAARVETVLIDDSDTDTDSDHRHRREPTEVSGAIIRYAYRVAGHDYQSTRLYAGRPVLSGGGAAAATVAKYPPNASVAVYYDPGNPAVAMLEPLNLINAKVASIGAAAFAGIGLLIILALLNVQ